MSAGPRFARAVKSHQARNPRVFGSIARGDDAEGSDLDLLVDTTESTRLFDIAAIELDLERLLGTPVHVTTAPTGPPPSCRRRSASTTLPRTARKIVDADVGMTMSG
jgi:predicted nucleotidyltransferase